MTGPAHAQSGLSANELARYSRHLVLPEVGMEGQLRLKKARVLCLGAGGLGSPAAIYLAAAGIGTLGLVDDDRVELSNLQRQILHGTKEVGRSKLDSARDRLGELNPEIAVELHHCRFNAQNGRELVKAYDIVIDGSDNLATRYLSNDACVFARKPNVYGSVFRFEGQTTVLAPHLDGPCYRCLFPEPPQPGSVPSCAEAGVVGVLPGVIGTLQALEAIKLILRVGNTLVGRLLQFDALKLRFREFAIRRDPECPICGDHPTITDLVDYEGLCSTAAGQENGQSAEIPTISALAASEKIRGGSGVGLLDVREPFEHQIVSLEGAELIPLDQLPEQWQRLDPQQELIVYCHTGVRSAHAVEWLRKQGFDKAVNLAGGIEAWANEVDPSIPRY